MNHKRLQHFINFICIAAILITGLYFSNVRSDSSCLSEPSGYLHTIKSVDTLPISEELISSELLGNIKCVYMRSHARENTEHNCCRPFILPSALHLLSNHLYHYFSGFTELLCTQTAFSQICIISYIHHQDGAKS